VTQAVGSGAAYTIGVIADTHGDLPDAARDALAGVDVIFHAGDVGGGSVLESLKALAPVHAVRGNNREPAELRLPVEIDTVAGAVRIVMAHQQADIVRSRATVRAGARVAISGHTHQPSIEEFDGVLWVNPGSPSCPRHGAPRSVALLHVAADGTVAGEIVPLR
jgi:putative phosphoesterase